jgi:hypothetical protein
MDLRNFKPLLVGVSAAFAAMVYTKKRIKKTNRLKAMHSKVNPNQDFTKES